MDKIKEKRKYKLPHTYVILAIFILFGFFLTFILPSGEYERFTNDAGVTVVNPDSFQIIDKDYLNVADLFMALPTGMINMGYIIFMIFIAAGAFSIITATGAMHKGINQIARAMRGKEVLAIPLLLFLFSICGATFGMSQEGLLFIPVCIMLARSLGYDAMIGMCMTLVGAQVGFQAGWMNPFNVGVSQGIAELPMYSAIGIRLVLWVLFLITTSWYMMRYARKIKANPTLSIVYELEQQEVGNTVIDLDHLEKMTKRQVGVLFVFVASLAVIIYGMTQLDWFINEMSAVFVAMGIFAGLIGGFSPSRICEEFVKGCEQIVYGCLIVGIAQAMVILLQQGMVIDTVVHGLAGLVAELPTYLTAIGMFLVQTLTNFFVNSGTGQAALTMPIMVPLSDILGVTRQTAVFAFQMGDGLSNAIFPTSPTLMAALGMAKIRYDQYLKFLMPIWLVWNAIAVFLLIYCTFAQVGPF